MSCKYHQNKKSIAEGKQDMWIEGSYLVTQYDYEIPISTKINFCPMCGAALKDELFAKK